MQLNFATLSVSWQYGHVKHAT